MLESIICFTLPIVLGLVIDARLMDYEIKKSLRKAERYIDEGIDEGNLEKIQIALKVFQGLKKSSKEELLLGILDREGLCYEELGELELAGRSYKEGFKKSKSEEDKSWFRRKWICVDSTRLRKRNKFSLAVRILKGVLENDLSYPRFHWLLAEIYSDQGEYNLVLEELDKFIDLERNLRNKATAFLKKGLSGKKRVI